MHCARLPAQNTRPGARNEASAYQGMSSIPSPNDFLVRRFNHIPGAKGCDKSVTLSFANCAVSASLHSEKEFPFAFCPIVRAMPGGRAYRLRFLQSSGTTLESLSC